MFERFICKADMTSLQETKTGCCGVLKKKKSFSTTFTIFVASARPYSHGTISRRCLISLSQWNSKTLHLHTVDTHSVNHTFVLVNVYACSAKLKVVVFTTLLHFRSVLYSAESSTPKADHGVTGANEQGLGLEGTLVWLTSCLTTAG